MLMFRYVEQCLYGDKVDGDKRNTMNGTQLQGLPGEKRVNKSRTKFEICPKTKCAFMIGDAIMLA